MGTASTSPVHFSCVLLLLLLSCFQCHLAQPRPSATVVIVGYVHSGSEPPVSGDSICRHSSRLHLRFSSQILSQAQSSSCDCNGRTVFLKQAITDRHGLFHLRLEQEPSGRLESVTSCSVQLQHPSSSAAAPCAAVTTTGGLRPVSRPNKHLGKWQRRCPRLLRR
jgi:hypothetical protein